jgi:hypothetical protein
MRSIIANIYCLSYRIFTTKHLVEFFVLVILCECLSSVFPLSCRSLPNLITLALNASLISSISSSDQLLSTTFITYILRYERSYPFRSRRPLTSLHLLTSYDLLTNGSSGIYIQCHALCFSTSSGRVCSCILVHIKNAQ